MKTLSFKTPKKTLNCNVPETWAELSNEQFVTATKMVQHGPTNKALATLTGAPIDYIQKLNRYQRLSVEQIFDFVYRANPDELQFTEWKVPTIDINKTTYYGPSSNFGNITWGEFIYTDQCFISGLFQAATAALFRPQRENYNGETDRRIPFSIYGTTARFSLFDNIPANITLAVVLNYKAVRRAALEEKYPYLFRPVYNTSDDEDDESDEQPSSNQQNTFSWTHVHRNLLGDRIEEEDKFLSLNVHTVLNRLNNVVKK